MENEPRTHLQQATAAVGAAAFMAPVAFTLAVIVQGVLQPDYSHVALPISALAAWPQGWVQTLNFIVLGSCTIAFGAVLDIAVRRGFGGGVLGPGLLALAGIVLVLAAAFPWQGVDGDFVVPTGHLVGAVLTFVGVGSGLALLSRRMSHDPRWSDLAGYTLASGIAVLVLFLLAGLARAEVSRLHPWLGLLQRFTLAVWFPCMMMLAFRLWRMARRVRPPGVAQRERTASDHLA